MDELNYVAMESYVIDQAILEDDGTWKTWRTIESLRTTDKTLKVWEKASFTVMAMDKDLTNARITCLKSAIDKIESLGLVLFNAPETDTEVKRETVIRE